MQKQNWLPVVSNVSFKILYTILNYGSKEFSFKGFFYFISIILCFFFKFGLLNSTLTYKYFLATGGIKKSGKK